MIDIYDNNGNIELSSANIAWEANSLKLTGEIINGDNSGRLAGNKDMYLEYECTFYNYEGTLVRGKNCSFEEWDRLFEVLSSPINDHYISFPLKQGELTSIYVYISEVERTLISRPANNPSPSNPNKAEFNLWSPKLNVKFVSMDPFITA